PARRRNRHRRDPPLGLGPSRAARGRGPGGDRRLRLPVASLRVSGRRTLATTAAVLLLPRIAHAHLVNTGLGPFYDGVSHFALTPEDLLPALALALLAGQRGSRGGRRALFALPGAWLAGGLAGLALPTVAAAPTLTTISFIALGALVAAEVPLPPPWVTGLAIALGLLHGSLNGSAMSRAGLGGLGLF